MDIQIQFDPQITLRTCKRCHKEMGSNHFLKTSSPFFVEGYSDICADCFKDYLSQYDFSWDAVDKICQYLDVPFIPTKFEELHSKFGEDVMLNYCDFFSEMEYQGLEWKTYYQEFKKLQAAGYIKDELPILKNKHKRQLQEKWGFNYDDEDLFYLESLYDGLLQTQNISGALQVDQALKLCKISCELDKRIQSGADVDKLISSYDKLVKTAEFTPKNVKNASDFDSVGELIKWLEKRGFVNEFYDNVTRDIVDETIKNIQAYNQRLYTNESDIGEQINERLAALKQAEELDNFYDLTSVQTDDNYESQGYEELFDEEFSEEME